MQVLDERSRDLRRERCYLLPDWQQVRSTGPAASASVEDQIVLQPQKSDLYVVLSQGGRPYKVDLYRACKKTRGKAERQEQ